MNNRRQFVASALCLAGAAPFARAQQPPDSSAVAGLRSGGTVLLLRHAQTDPGVGDPPGFRLGSCSTQRNLSESGRAQARAIGADVMAQGLRPAAVKSSAWCRCVDTATLAFGRAEPWAALNSLFQDRDAEAAQTKALQAGLAAVAPWRFEVWVTHAVNIMALCSESVAMGEGVVLRAGVGQVHNLGRLKLAG
ncbi:MAG TPA: histidine phosphatase family protein [Rubrivivax sp.]